MAHSMNMSIVAEGVEEQNQFDMPANFSCDEKQGYLVSKPVPATEITEMLISSKLKEPEQLELAT